MTRSEIKQILEWFSFGAILIGMGLELSPIEIYPLGFILIGLGLIVWFALPILKVLGIFETIRIVKVHIGIDTEELWELIRNSRRLPNVNVIFYVSMEIALREGFETVRNKVTIEWDIKILDELAKVILSLRPFHEIEFEAEPKYIIFEPSNPRKQLKGSRDIEIKIPINREITREYIENLDRISNQMEGSKYKIIWESSGKRKVYKHHEL